MTEPPGNGCKVVIDPRVVIIGAAGKIVVGVIFHGLPLQWMGFGSNENVLTFCISFCCCCCFIKMHAEFAL